VYKTVILNIDERFLFERKHTPVKNALFILLPHYNATTTVRLLQYTASGTGVSRREDNIIYHCVYAYKLCMYIYIITNTRTRPIIYIGPFRYSSGPYPTYIRRRCHVYNVYNIIYDISNVYSFPIGNVYIYISIYTYAWSSGARRAYLYIIIFPGQIAAAVTGCDRLCYHVRVVVAGLLIIIQKEKSRYPRHDRRFYC